MLKIALCDDNSNFLQLLEAQITSFIDNTAFECSIKSFNSLNSLELYLESQVPDILLLDLMFGDENSIEWAKEHLSSSRTALILMTAFPGQAYSISEIPHVYYIIKKIERNKIPEQVLNKALIAAIKLIVKNHRKQTIVKTKDEHCILDYNEIVYIEAANNHIVLQMKNTNFIIIYSPLSKFSENLPANFIRCHKSYVVNMNYISSFKPNSFIMKDGTYIPIPSKKYKYTIKKLESYTRLLGE